MIKRKNWPWKLTHFILSEKCIACGYATNTYDANVPQKPFHFIMAKNDIFTLLHVNFFWCQNCHEFLIYDHYPCDECEVCMYLIDTVPILTNNRIQY